VGSAKELADQFYQEQENGHKLRSETKAKPPAPTHDELRDRFLVANSDLFYGLGSWQRYKDGVHSPIPEAEVKGLIADVLEESKPEGIKPSLSAVNSVAGLAQFKAFIQDEYWDADPDILVCANGALHIPSGELRKHSERYYSTTSVPYFLIARLVRLRTSYRSLRDMPSPRIRATRPLFGSMDRRGAARVHS
jgi:hypothetical protein